jgi:hypothetical protein
MAPTDHDAEITELIWAEISKQRTSAYSAPMAWLTSFPVARRCESGASDADQARLQQVLADFSLDGLENLIAKCTRTLRNGALDPVTIACQCRWY